VNGNDGQLVHHIILHFELKLASDRRQGHSYSFWDMVFSYSRLDFSGFYYPL
jgi:hypothetical protein